MNYHPVVEKITKILQENGVWSESFEHEPVRTSEEAAEVRTGYTLKEGAKALILRIKSGGAKKFVMLVVPGNTKFDKDKVKKSLDTKDLRFATEEEVLDITGGVLPGGVPPFGNLFNLDVYADKNLFNNEKIIFNAGDKRYSIAMKSIDYQTLVGPIITELT